MISRVRMSDVDDPSRRSSALGLIREAFERDGAFYLSDHGVPDPVFDATFDAAADLHRLPPSEKRAVSIAGSELARGWHQGIYSGKGTYESFEVGPEAEIGSGGDFTRILHGPNRWPSITGFREIVSAYLESMSLLSRRIADALETAFDLPDGYLRDRCGQPSSLLRMLRYQGSAGTFDLAGIAPHTDFELFTLIAEDSPGLEICNRDGRWQRISTGERTELLVLAGDLFEVVTGGRVESPLHRVPIAAKDRRSLAYFFGLNADSSVSPQLESNQPVSYGELSVGMHLATMHVISYPHLRERYEDGSVLDGSSLPRSNPFKEYKLGRLRNQFDPAG